MSENGVVPVEDDDGEDLILVSDLPGRECYRVRCAESGELAQACIAAQGQSPARVFYPARFFYL